MATAASPLSHMNPPSRTSSIVLQVLSSFAIALGAGLFVAGNSLYPLPLVNDLGQVISSQGWQGRNMQSTHEIASTLKGSGVGIMILGILGVLIPWLNALIHGRKTPVTRAV